MRVLAGALLVAACAVLALGVPALAPAATCPTAPADPDPLPTGAELQVLRLRQEQAASCARLAELEQAGNDSLSEVAANTAGGEGPSEVSGVVELSEGDRQSLDLVWIGIFLFAGLTAGFFFVTKAWAEIRQWFHF